MRPCMSTVGIWLFALFCMIVSGSCACGDDDDDAKTGDICNDDDDTEDDDDDDSEDDDSTDDDASDDDDDDDDDDWIEPTAWDDFLAAEAQVALSNFSVAVAYYDSCILKLEDAEPQNDGPVEPFTLERAEYGFVVMLITLPLRIIESFLSGWLTGSDLVLMMEQALDEAGVDEGEQPTSLITVYLLEIILPLLEQACDRMDHARQAEDFIYPMPPIRFVFNGSAFEIPAVTDSNGRGEHDRTEAHLLAGLLHLVTSAALVVTTQNLDTSAARIDDILDILMSGDFTEIMGLLEDFPNLLTLHDDEVVDGPAMMLDAHRRWTNSFNALHDDNDGDGYWRIHDNGTPFYSGDDFIDPGEWPDDFYDAWQSETDDQTDDILRLTDRGGLSLNIKADGAEIGSGGIAMALSLLAPLLTDALVEEVFSAVMGFFPPEENDRNRLDDDLAAGISSALSATTLTDSAASYAPGELVGFILNPNTRQPQESEANITFEIAANTATTITVTGDMTAVAEAGDPYSVGDGWIDDRPADLSLILHLLIGDFVPLGNGAGLYIGEFFDQPTDFRYLLPAWDEEEGNPAFLNFVVDETETFNDINGNGRYDLGIDSFVDAAHSYGSAGFSADGFFEPYYFFFTDGTFGGLLPYRGDWATGEPVDNLNRILSGILMIGGAP